MSRPRLVLRRVAAALLATALVTAGWPAPARAESNGGVRILPLGDSITDGYNVPGGYRINLWRALAAAGHPADFVGSGLQRAGRPARP